MLIMHPEHGIEALDQVMSVRLPVMSMKRSAAKRSRAGRRYFTQILLTSAPLVAADMLSLLAATLLAFAFSGSSLPGFELELAFSLACLTGALLLVYAMFGLYPGTGLNPIVELRQVSIATTLLFIGFIAANLVFAGGRVLTSFLAVAYGFSLAFVPILRFVARSFFSRFQWWGQPVLIFGDAAGATNYRHLQSHPYLGLRPIGILGNVQPEQPAYLGHPERAPLLAKQQRIFWAIVAMPERSPSEVIQTIKTHASHFPHVLVVPNMDGLPSLWNHSCDCGGSLGIRMESNLLLPLPRLLKRMVDIAIVIAGGLCLCPVLGIIALLIKISSSGPVIYGQERIGLKGRRFRAWKFRTMVADADKVLEWHLAQNPSLRKEWEMDHKLKNDPRVTRIGRWLRKTSLDELPQLWNVLRGEMSLVGPRPIVKAEINKYGECFDLYTKVLPGITGLWQISGRNNTTYAERIHLDSYYVRNWSTWMDAYILARTVKVVLRGEGAY